MLFYYVRHGDPIYKPDSLTTLGTAQAEALKHRFATHGLDRIYSSTSNRAYLTAEPTAELLKLPVTRLEWCKESHAFAEFSVTNDDGERVWPFYEKRCIEAFVSPELIALGDRWYEHPAFAGTNIKEGIERIDREVDAFFLSLGYKHDREKNVFIPVAPNDERVALFAHEGFGMAFFSSVLGIPYPLFCTRFGISHSCFSVIEFKEHFNTGFVIPQILQHSNDSHLYAERMPLKYHNRIYV